MKSPGVYRIFCKKNGRNYVGSSTKDWRNRRNGHVCLLKAGKHPSKKMQADWNLYGPSEFLFLLVCECEADRAIEIEKASAETFKAFCPEMGYNTSPIREGRFRAGRKASGGTVRFSRMVKPETARKLAEMLSVEKNGIVRLEHASVRGLKHGLGEAPRIIGFSHSDSPDELFARLASKPGPIPMAIDSQEVVRLKSRVKELEAKVRDYENTYSQ